MNATWQNSIHWIAGAILALGGAAAARLTGDHPAEMTGVIIHVAGVLGGGLGLLIIAVGVRRRTEGK